MENQSPGSPAASAPPIAPTTTSGESFGRFGPSHENSPTFNREETAELVGILRDKGVSEEKLAQAFNADNQTLPPPPSPINAELQAFDEFFPAAKSPEDYKLPLPPSNVELTSEYMKNLQATRELLHVMRFSPEGGAAFIEECRKGANLWNSLDETGREIQTRNEHSNLQKLWGPKTNENIDLAIQLIAEMDRKSPGTVRWFYDSGAVDSAGVMVALFHQAQRLYHRAGIPRPAKK